MAKEAQNEVFQVFEKAIHGPFLIFCTKLQVFIGKNLVLKSLDKKVTQNEFFEFYKKSMYFICLIFHMKF